MKPRDKVPLTVYLLSLVSFFNDIASEMIYPVIPVFLTQALGAPVYILGIIDGAAEGIASFSKSYFGHLSDKYQKRKLFVVTGYSASAISKVIIAFSFTWPILFAGRVIDRFGKGIRTAPRDALLLASATKNNKGKIFGLHRAFDSAGAVVGPLIALYLLHLYPNNMRIVLYAAIIPSFIGLLFFLIIHESKKNISLTPKRPSFLTSLKNQPMRLRYFVLILAIFSLGNSTDSFLILKAKTLGLTLVDIILVYVVYNIIYSILSTPAGQLADKFGAKKIFLVGLFLYTLVYLGFAFNNYPILIWLLFPIYGAYIALTDGVSKALIGSLVTPEQGGMAYGISQTVTSIFTLLASIIGGILWSAISPKATFIFGALCALSAFLLYLFFDLQENSRI